MGDDKIADFTVGNQAALMPKHPQRDICTVPETTDVECFSTSEFHVHKAPMSFVIGFSESLDGISQQCFKEWTAKSKEQTGLNYLQALTSLGNLILQKKVLDDLRLYFGAESIVQEVPDMGLRTVAIENTLRWLSAKCAL